MERRPPRGLLCALLLWALTTPANPQTGEEATEIGERDRAAIRSVIQSQLAAFQRDDDVAAFSYASPSIQAKFGTSENFMQMVKSGYQAVYRPRAVEFRDLILLQGELIQQVFVVGPDGVPVIALYLMQLQPDGSWKINGCILAAVGEKAIHSPALFGPASNVGRV